MENWLHIKERVSFMTEPEITRSSSVASPICGFMEIESNSGDKL